MKMILIPGRSAKQGTSLNHGKLKEEYIETTSTLEMNPDDMQKLKLSDGDSVRLKNATGEALVKCIAKSQETYLLAWRLFLMDRHPVN